MTVQNPTLRTELLAYLKDGCDPSHYLARHEVEFDLHFFFDDHDFADAPLSLIGTALLDETEAAAITDLVTAYATAIGTASKMPDVTTLDWQPVVAAAQKAYACLLDNGEQTQPDRD